MLTTSKRPHTLQYTSLEIIPSLFDIIGRPISLSGHYHGHSSSQADPGGHRGEARRHHQAGDLHQGTPRHVHGYGHACRESGKTANEYLDET